MYTFVIVILTDHDDRDGPSQSQRGSTRGANRIWRRGDKRVSFNDKRGGGISKHGRGGPRGGDRNRPKFNIRTDAILGTNYKDL